MDRFNVSEDGWADAVTFSVVLHNLSVDEYQSWKTSDDALPVQVLPDYLRASVRQLCFDSLVGKTLSLLHFHARVLRNSTQYDRLANLVVRFETAMFLLQPLVEGLASFAMFDQTIGDSEILSYPISEIPYYFLQMGVRGSDDISPREISEILAESRLGIGEGWRRKSSVLRSHLDCRLDPRLTGYMTVKNLQRMLRELPGLERLANGELFSILMVEAFFQDPGIVLALLDNEAPPTLTTQRIVDSVQSRLLWLAQLDAHTVNRFLDAQLDENGERRESDLLHSSDLYARAEMAMEKWHEPIREEPIWIEFAWAAFTHRPPLTFYLVDNQMEAEDGETIRAPSMLCEETAIREGSPEPEDEKESEEYNARLALNLQSRQELSSLRDEVFEFASAHSNQALSELTEGVLPDAANRIYRSWALAFVSEEKHERTQLAMSERGLQGLGLSANGVETLSLLSLLPERLGAVQLHEECSERGLDLAAALAEWDLVREEYGLKLVEQDFSGIRPLV
ncbi:MAG: hypothetical protein J0H02_14700 [Armatimonadetes bacterium]|nr:hypothetical protein [Armatimonadota bacterium]